MAKLSAAEVAYLVQIHWGAASDARGQPNDVTAIAIAMCESGGDTNAHNSSGEDSRGLFQINWDAWENALPQVQNPKDLFDPNVNVRAAHYIWQQAGLQFTDWSCYINGGYVPHIPEARDAAANPTKPGDVTVTGQDAPNPNPSLNPLKTALGTLVDEDTWIRVGTFIGGVVLVLIALVMVVGPRAADLLPIGRIAKRVAG